MNHPEDGVRNSSKILADMYQTTQQKIIILNNKIMLYLTAVRNLITNNQEDIN
jgi:hypothetical protein